MERCFVIDSPNIPSFKATNTTSIRGRYPLTSAIFLTLGQKCKNVKNCFK